MSDKIGTVHEAQPSEFLWGMAPRIHGGGNMKKLVSKFTVALIAALMLAGFSLPVFAQSVNTQNVDLRVEVHNLLTDMSNVRSGETWNAWVNQWDHVVRTKYDANIDIDALAYGQVVEVPQSPADWAYVDWEEVPYPARPSVALAHACDLMTGRVYSDGSLAWDADDELLRFEAANIAARTIELVFEVVLNTATYSRPGCPLAMEAFHGDPEVFKDLIERQAVRHDEVVAELRAAIAALESRPDLSDEVRALIRQDLDLRVEFQSEMSALVRDINARWDELKSEVGSLWIVLAEYDQKLADLRSDILAQVWALCADGACRGEQGPQGPRGLQGPQGPAGPAANIDPVWDEFNRLRLEMEGDYVTRPEFVEDQARQDARIDDLDHRVTVIENTLGRVSMDYCPVWLNFTGTKGVGEFDQQNPYRPGMDVSANVGVNALDAAAGVQIVSFDVGQGNRPNDRADWWKESAYYESLPLNTVISITVRDATGATCSQSHTLYGN